MTSETMAIEAGPELDEQVHVRVFGLPAIPWDHATPCPECGDEMRYCGARSRCSTCNEWRTSPYREYSTEIAAAWAVVEKMRDRGWYRFELETGRDHARARFGNPVCGWPVSAKEAPHAITLAALAAFEVESAP